MKVGITGHQRLKDTSVWPWVAKGINAILGRTPRPLVGISSLAIGADQLFADSVLEQGGILHVIVPFREYEETFTEPEDRSNYNLLLHSATNIEVLEKVGSNQEAYYEAGKKLVDLSDIVIAVWDGRSAAGLGGTADVVDYAKSLGKIVIHVNPVLRSIAVL